MNTLVEHLTNYVKEKVRSSYGIHQGRLREARFIFYGPPRSLLKKIYDALTTSGGVRVPQGETEIIVPVLLPQQTLPDNLDNPPIGESGICDINHLIDIRNNPSMPSFLALAQPGLEINKTIDSTKEELGLNGASNTGYADFDTWWNDSFIQELVTDGLHLAGFDESEIGDAKELVGRAAAAVDAMDRNHGAHEAVWRLISRIYSISSTPVQMERGKALALACGVPPMPTGGIAPRIQLGVLRAIAAEFAGGFKTAVRDLAEGAELDDVNDALFAFLDHVEERCLVPTAFERVTQAFYLPHDDFTLQPPPSWWSTLTTERWTELLKEEPDVVVDNLTITCANPLISPNAGMPAIVKENALLTITTEGSSSPVTVNVAGGPFGLAGQEFDVLGELQVQASSPRTPQRSPITFKAVAEGQKSATTKVISLANWAPGILVTSRMATKLTNPKKPEKRNSEADWENMMSLPGSGRYEILIFTAPDATIHSVLESVDDSYETEHSSQELQLSKTKEWHKLEIEVDDKLQLDINFQIANKPLQVYRVYIQCDQVKEVGCRSEFERLIKLNRRHLEKFDAKAVVNLEWNSRLSSLQTWILEKENAFRSFIPMILSDDYEDSWASPNWGLSHGPVFSSAQFLHDPRPDSARFQPPDGFIASRIILAERIRNTAAPVGLLESSPLGKWMAQDPDFVAAIERYVGSYTAWLQSDPDVACWTDVIAVCRRDSNGHTLDRVPDAVILSPLHPLRLAWHCLAQQALYEEVEGDGQHPCPAASILDPSCVPDILTLTIQSPGGVGVEHVDFLSVECDSDYWSVLWNGSRLNQISGTENPPPFTEALGLVVSGIASGFSPAQVARALDDVSDLLAAKPVLSVAISSSGGATDACNEGLITWCSRRFGDSGSVPYPRGVGPRFLEVFDTRTMDCQPDEATIANLSEDTGHCVRWFRKHPSGRVPDLGIIAQLSAAEAECKPVEARSAVGYGGLIRHRVRRQLPGAYLAESRQGAPASPSGSTLAVKVSACLATLENRNDQRVGLQFAPDVHAVSEMFEKNGAIFAAVSSSSIDPACFLGGWIDGTYLWDYDLPAYSHRAGDTNGYYLLSRVKEADRDALERVLRELPDVGMLDADRIDFILQEVARRGIPTVRGLSGDDMGAAGDLGLFVAARLLQDSFRVDRQFDSLLPVLWGADESPGLALVVPVDPFRGYLSDLARSFDRHAISLSRPDLLVVGIAFSSEGELDIRLTPIEVKYRNQPHPFNRQDAQDALSQARALSILLSAVIDRTKNSTIWKLAYQHLLLSIIGFGLRVYSRNALTMSNQKKWTEIHEAIAKAILTEQAAIEIDHRGRLIVIDGSPNSVSRDCDGDGFNETIALSQRNAAQIVALNPTSLYLYVRQRVGDWDLLPESTRHQLQGVIPIAEERSTAVMPSHSSGEQKCSSTSPSDFSADNMGSSISGEEGVVLTAGTAVDSFEPRQIELNISDTRLNQLNIGVVGDLGTGKTQLLKSIIFQISQAEKANRGIKPRFLIFDYKRDYSSDDFVSATGAQVVKPHRLPLNLFDVSTLGESQVPWLDRFRFFTDVLDKIYSGIGPVQRDKLKSAVRNAYEAGSAVGVAPTIYDVHTEYRTILSGKPDSPMAIIDDLVDMEIFERDVRKTVPFDEFLNGVVVISLDSLGQDDRSKNMLVAVLLNMFYENMLRIPKRPFLGTSPQLRAIDSYLLVDEADNIMQYEFDVLRKLLLQGREFGVGVILASQYLRHFKVGGTDYREPLLTWFIHKVPNVTAAELSALGFPSDLGELAGRVKTLPNHHCLYKSFDVSGEVIKGLPFFELHGRRR